MRSLKYVALMAVLLLTTVQLAYAAKGKGVKTTYVFGVATSFNDSTAYVTAIQQLDSVTTVGKQAFWQTNRSILISYVNSWVAKVFSMLLV